MSLSVTKKLFYITDCEGPITKNDIAFEICNEYLPEGAKFYTNLSNYDDILAYAEKRHNYRVGSTPKLILPFFVLFGITEKNIMEYSKNNLLLIKDIKEMLNRIKEFADIFIISTSYKIYIEELCKYLNFPIENTISTTINLKGYKISKEESAELAKIYDEILKMEVPKLKDYDPQIHKTLVDKLNSFFWDKICSMSICKLLHVKTIGGKEKTNAIKRITKDFKNTIYVGDSITDVDALRFINSKGGLAISFNGNRYAIENSDLALISNSAEILAMAVISYFVIREKKKAIKFLIQSLNGYTTENYWKAFYGENIMDAVKISEEFRSKYRGEKIGSIS